jgi:phosphodiesterase/alkaline phosphatase D-like protein
MTIKIPITLAALVSVLAFSAAPALAAAPETPETKPATGETATTAVLHGVLNPLALTPPEPGSYQFDYALAETGGCTGGGVAPVSPALALGTVAEAKQVTVTGLEPNREYLFCVVAYSLGGGIDEPASGAAVAFKTLVAKPSIVLGSENASGATSTGATLEAQVDANNESTTYVFEYSTTESGGALTGIPVKVDGGSAIEGYGDQTASVPTLVLTPGTSYFYRVVATNGTGTSDGPVTEFATVATPKTEPVTPIGTTTATFNGKLTPLNAKVPAEYYFEYNLGEEPVCTNESATTPESAGTEAVSTAVTPLEPNHAYTVCLVSKNAFGSEEDLVSPPVHFTTKPAAPEIISETSSALTPEGATLEATVNPNNQATTCQFEYSTNASLPTGPETTTAPCPKALGNGGSGVATSVPITGLKLATPYYYRVDAMNATGESQDTTIGEFTTENTIAPILSATATTNETATSATLNAQIDPNGAASEYHFEYDTIAYGKGEAAHGVSAPAVKIPGGRSAVAVSQQIDNLAPNTEYHWRLVATSAAGTTTTVDQTFSYPIAAGESPAQPITGPGEATPGPPAPGAVFPLLSAPSIAELNAREAQEAKKIPTPTTPLTNAQKLTKALKACHKKKRAKRTKCEKQAHSKYGKKKGKK